MNTSSSNKSNSKKDTSTKDHHEDLAKPPKESGSKPVSTARLRNDSRDRAKKRPLVQKITRMLSGQADEPFRELIINSEPLETRVAMLVDGVLEKFQVEQTGAKRMVGSIYKGKIQNLEPGLKAAFVDIGQEKNAFLHYWDVIPTADDKTIEVVRENRSEAQRRGRPRPTLKDIPKLYPIGADIVVQITKGQIGTKGPRTTTNLSIAGRYLVLMPYNGQCGVSRKIDDRNERDRLKKALRGLTIPDGMGVIIRTAGEGKKIRFFIRDLYLLIKKWDEISRRMEIVGDTGMLYQEPNIIERTVRDFLTEDIDRVLVDDEAAYQNMVNVVEEISPRSKRKINRFTDDIPIFERFNIERQIEQTFQRKVPLPSGGEIVIEETEALTAIDVNTGSHRGTAKDGTGYIVQANLEAAIESARQVRLRNIGGLIIVDFIDMKNKRDRKAVYDQMRREMESDRAKSHVLPISLLGIMQLTRQRHTESNISGIYTGCPYCSGRGIVKSPRTMSVEIQRRMVSVTRHWRNSPEAVSGQELHLRVLLHPSNLDRLRTEDRDHLKHIEEAYKVKLSFRSDPSFHIENFKVIDPKTGQEMK